MNQVTLIVLLALVSLFVPVQVAATNRLNTAVGAAPLAVLGAFVVGSLGLCAVLATGALGRGHLARAASAPWWAWSGGLLTAAVLTAQVATFARVGAGAAVAVSVTGQLVASLVVDHFGWFDAGRAPINLWRVGGAVLLVGGAVLMQKK